MFEELRTAGFDIMVRNHAQAILGVDFPRETQEIIAALCAVHIPAQELIASGGGEAPSTQRLRKAFSELGWSKHNFRIETTVDGIAIGDGTSHEIDHIRRSEAGTLALEIEWNNKDPFFDRDLENFQRLHAQSIISAGIIITRGAAMQQAMETVIADYLHQTGITDESALVALGMKKRTDRQSMALAQALGKGERFAEAFARIFVADKFGTATTHWSKLEDRINRGVGNPCPLLLIGLPANAISPYSAASAEL